MNCRAFQNELFEYVEGTLSASAQAAAERHLAGCDACRQAVQKEQHLAKMLSTRLQQVTETLTLRPDIRRRILAAPKNRPVPLTLVEAVTDAWERFLRPALIPVSLLVIACVVFAYYSGTRSHEPSHETAAIKSVDVSQPSVVSVQISGRVPIYRFHREGNLLVDAVSYETVVASGTLPPSDNKPIQQLTLPKYIYEN